MVEAGTEPAAEEAISAARALLDAQLKVRSLSSPSHALSSDGRLTLVDTPSAHGAILLAVCQPLLPASLQQRSDWVQGGTVGTIHLACSTSGTGHAAGVCITGEREGRENLGGTLDLLGQARQHHIGQHYAVC